MTNLFQVCLLSVCVLIYVPVMMNAFQQIQRGEVVLRGVSMARGGPRRFTGASAFVYALAQAISAGVVIMSLLIAFSEGVLVFVLGLIIAMATGWVGLWLATAMGFEELPQTPEEQILGTLAQIFSNATGGRWTGQVSYTVAGTDDDPQQDENEQDDDDQVIISSQRPEPSLKPTFGVYDETDIEDADFRPVDHQKGGEGEPK